MMTNVPELMTSLVATNHLLAAIQLMGLAPTDSAAHGVWIGLLARARNAVNAFK